MLWQWREHISFTKTVTIIKTTEQNSNQMCDVSKGMGWFNGCSEPGCAISESLADPPPLKKDKKEKKRVSILLKETRSILPARITISTSSGIPRSLKTLQAKTDNDRYRQVLREIEISNPCQSDIQIQGLDKTQESCLSKPVRTWKERVPRALVE